uniref:type II toxin-antitoxin system RelE/ParE family toxin n=1 Tax=Candidatus Electronema sp. TaxID=2698783 RepID=UPI004056F127
MEEYLDSLSGKQAEKVFFVLDIVKKFELVPSKFLKKLEAADDIWEIRIQQGNDIFCLLGFFNGEQLIVLNHAFTKKSQKTPQKEIKTAEQHKKDYFSRKGLQ